MEEPGDLRERIVAVLRRRPVQFAYLFGSRAIGAARADSDIDLAVRFAPELDATERFELTLRLGAELEVAVDRQVDLVDLDTASLRLVGRILKERVVLLGLDDPARVEFEMRLFKLAVDFEHHAAALTRHTLSAMAEGRR
jgi:uncharacterized protein